MANPISQDKTVMRHTLLAGMLDRLAANARWRDRQVLFEVGKVFLPVEGEKLPAEPTRLAIVMTGPRGTPTWQGGHDTTPMDYFDLKGVVETLLNELHISPVDFVATEHSTFRPGRTAALMINQTQAGVLGELHPLVAAAFDLPKGPILAAEFDLDLLMAAIPAMHAVHPVSRYEAIYQDIAVVVDQGIRAADVEAVIWEAGGWLLRGVRLFDVYRGDQIGADKKSLAYALTFQADDKTLRDVDAARVQGKIVKELEKRLGAKLRE
jgi:phenylalanyl-tRNA synthetase beta chain